MTIDKEIEIISTFLEKNGFKKIETNVWGNDYCSVSIGDETNPQGYAVCDNEGWAAYSQDMNIYWLVGYLTWRGFLTQNYIK